jgi:hypothetical protein
MAEMVVDKGAPSRHNSPRAADAETTGTGAARSAHGAGAREPQRAGRRLSPSEHAVIEAMIAEAVAMRRRLKTAE